MKSGCARILLLAMGLAVLYLGAFYSFLPPPLAVVLTVVCVPMAMILIGGISSRRAQRRDRAALERARNGEPLRDGQLEAAVGPIHPILEPLRSPFTRVECVAYQYEVSHHTDDTRRAGDKQADAVGFALTPSVIRTTRGDVRMLGWALLDEFEEERVTGEAALDNAREYLAEASPQTLLGGSAVLKMLGQMDGVLADDDGAVRKDWKLASGELPRPGQRLTERRVSVGAHVCAFGIYSRHKGGLVCRGHTMNRLYRGVPAETEPSSLGASIVLFVGAHLFAAFWVYLSLVQ